MTSLPAILLVDSDPGIRRGLADQLLENGRYSVVDASDFSGLAANPVELVIVAVSDGSLAAIDSLRSAQPVLPIIALVASGRPAIGAATQTLERPFRLTMLLDAIERALTQPGIWRIGPYALEMREKRLVWSDGVSGDRAGEVIRLTEKEAMMLECLVRADGAVVPRDQLLTDVWGYHPDATTHTLETHIYRLRRKIEPRQLRLITEPGGYRLTV